METDRCDLNKRTIGGINNAQRLLALKREALACKAVTLQVFAARAFMLSATYSNLTYAVMANELQIKKGESACTRHALAS